ncbi:MAG: PPOX class F420-dependent oxidoreductase [Anaerolineales bacterium]|nr:PPOX class F420-dependent oxidoreductase [Anaerolineales bacterium]MCZ2120931.1 PPOX class F420-dependent oxidoreductase [Anaerolineales bacterium]
MKFPENMLDLIDKDSKAFLFLATTMPDGSPQVTPVWFDTEGEYILVNTAQGRIKDKNMRARPQVAMTIPDPNNTYRYLGMRGEVVSYTTEGGAEHINQLSLKYSGKPWELAAGQTRVIFKIKPTRFDAHN